MTFKRILIFWNVTAFKALILQIDPLEYILKLRKRVTELFLGISQYSDVKLQQRILGCNDLFEVFRLLQVLALQTTLKEVQNFVRMSWKAARKTNLLNYAGFQLGNLLL